MNVVVLATPLEKAKIYLLLESIQFLIAESPVLNRGLKAWQNYLENQNVRMPDRIDNCTEVQEKS